MLARHHTCARCLHAPHLRSINSTVSIIHSNRCSIRSGCNSSPLHSLPLNRSSHGRPRRLRSRRRRLRVLGWGAPPCPAHRLHLHRPDGTSEVRSTAQVRERAGHPAARHVGRGLGVHDGHRHAGVGSRGGSAHRLHKRGVGRLDGDVHLLPVARRVGQERVVEQLLAWSLISRPVLEFSHHCFSYLRQGML